MPVKNNLCVVQFCHPGQEAWPNPINGNKVPWNVTGKHKRKFMNCLGDYVSSDCVFQSVVWEGAVLEHYFTKILT